MKIRKTEEDKRVNALVKLLNKKYKNDKIKPKDVTVVKYNDKNGFDTSYVINHTQVYVILTDEERPLYGAWQLWMGWDGVGNKNILLERYWIYQEFQMSGGPKKMPKAYFELFLKLQNIKTHPVVDISETDERLQQMAKIIANEYDYTYLFEAIDSKEYREGKYYIYRTEV